MKKMTTYFPVAIALIAGAGLGYCLAPSAPAPAAPQEQKAEAPRRVRGGDDSSGERSANRALRARVKELEEMLAKQGIEVEKMKEEESERRERRERPRFDPRAEMERMQKENPERYAQMTNGMAQFRRRRLERAQSKMDFLASVDTSMMSPEARKVHADLQDMIEKREAIEDKMRNFLDMSEEERRATFDEMRETDGKIRELNRAERENLLAQTAQALGFQGDDATEIVETVKGIYEATENGGWGGPGGPGGPGGGRGNRGGGRGRGGNR